MTFCMKNDEAHSKSMKEYDGHITCIKDYDEIIAFTWVCDILRNSLRFMLTSLNSNISGCSSSKGNDTT